MVDPRFSIANRDMAFLQEQNDELKEALLTQTQFSVEKEEQLQAVKKQLEELQRAYDLQTAELDRYKKAYRQQFEIDWDENDGDDDVNKEAKKKESCNVV